jgi:hypothetical protein
MKVVAVIAIIAMLFVSLAPGVDLNPVALRAVRAATHAVRSVLALLPAAQPGLHLSLSHSRVLAIRPHRTTLPVSSLLELECTWLC